MTLYGVIFYDQHVLFNGGDAYVRIPRPAVSEFVRRGVMLDENVHCFGDFLCPRQTNDTWLHLLVGNERYSIHVPQLKTDNMCLFDAQRNATFCASFALVNRMAANNVVEPWILPRNAYDHVCWAFDYENRRVGVGHPKVAPKYHVQIDE
ncbi:hypothetical protein M3Y99_01338900 [Aphelenchoides fujianensis]|nr:hypothetical protein M3Y99_01338900 [Aphelenchoides fujianensis]